MTWKGKKVIRIVGYVKRGIGYMKIQFADLSVEIVRYDSRKGGAAA